ncbi:MAG: DUF4062 domain-containing protein [Planctomycetota bacterium]
MRIFLSSASQQTQAFRQAVIDVCTDKGCELLCMERWGPGTKPPLEACLTQVALCDLFIFIWSPDLGSRLANGKTITETEYDTARQRGRPILALVPNMSEQAEACPYSAGQMFDISDDARRLLKALTDLEQGHVCAPFTGARDLAFIVYERLSKDIASAREAPTEPPAPTCQRRFVFGRYSLMATQTLVGRNADRELLRGWWQGGNEAHGCPVLAIVAYGGTGKSALAWHWLRTEVETDAAVEAVVWFSFYETGATFQDFLLRLAAFLLQRPLDSLTAALPSEGIDALQEEVLDHLDRRRCVVVLDGLERILIGYSRLDAQRRDEAELDEASDNQFTAGAGRDEADAAIVASAAGVDGRDESVMQRLRRRALRESQDGRADRFLRCLCGCRASKILITTRLLPVTLQHGDTCIGGVFAHPMKMLDIDDGAALLRALDVRGPDSALRRLVEGCSGYALLLSKLAGRIKKDRPHDHDLDLWLAEHENFDPWSLQDQLESRNHHVLEYALEGVAPSANQILNRLAAARGPLPMRALLEELVGEGKVFASLSAFDLALSDLRERDLIGFDHTTQRIDLHPLVRGRVWTLLRDDERVAVNRSLSITFRSDYEKARKETSDAVLEAAEHYFDFVLGAGDLVEAWQVLDFLFARVSVRVGDYGRLAEWFDRFVAGRSPPEWHPEPAVAAEIATTFGGILIHAGRVREAAEILAPFASLTGLPQRQRGGILKQVQFTCMARGQQLEALEAGMEGVALGGDDLSGNLLYLCYGLVESRSPHAQRAVRAYLTVEDSSLDRPMFEAWLAFQEGRHGDAQDHAERFLAAATEEHRPSASVVARKQLGIAKLRQGDLAGAIADLDEARRDSRRLGMVWTEAQASCGLAEALVRTGELARARQLLYELLLPAKRDDNQSAQADVFETLALLHHAEGTRESAEHFAHEAARLTYQSGPPAYKKTQFEKIAAWLAENGYPAMRDLPDDDPRRVERVERLDFAVFDRIEQQATARKARPFVYSKYAELSASEIEERLAERMAEVAAGDLPKIVAQWWEAFCNGRPRPEVLKTLERLAARQSTLPELHRAFVDAGCDDIDAVFQYHDYTRLRKQEEAKKKGEAILALPVGDPFDPVEDTIAWDNRTATSGADLDSEIADLRGKLDWANTTGSARQWWEAFEAENGHRKTLVVRLMFALRHLQSSITEFFLSYVYSNTDNIAANLHYLRYRQIKTKVDQARRAEREARRIEQEIEPPRGKPVRAGDSGQAVELVFVRCHACRSLVPSESRRCRMCGAALGDS